jgi:N-acetylglutamate synthase-like GNAT family acetyltransferase
MNTIRSAAETDAPEISRVVRASIHDLCVEDHNNAEEVIGFWTANKTAATMLAWLSNPENITLVSESGHGGLAGIVMGTRLGHMLLLYVDPANVKGGVGSRLLESLEYELAAIGVSNVTANSTKSALTFYQGKGFVWGGESDRFGALTSYPIKKAVGRGVSIDSFSLLHEPL